MGDAVDTSLSGDLPVESPLSLAVREGDTERVELLLQEADADLNAVDTCGNTPLTYAVQHDRLDIVKMMLQDKNKINPDNYKHAFFAAAGHYSADGRVVELLLTTFDIDVNTTDANGSTALHLAASESNYDIVDLLLETDGIDINKKDKSDMTALGRALVTRKESVLNLLLPRKDLAWDAKLENDILEAARKEDPYRLDILLIQACASVKNTLSPLSWSALRGQVEVLQLLLLRGGVNVNAKDDCGRTPLIWAAQCGRVDAVEMLLNHGADANMGDRYSQTPLWWATMANEEEVVKRLIPIDNSTLHLLVKEGKLDGVKLMLRCGMKLDQRNRHGQTALHLAAENGRLEIAKALMSGGADINSEDYSGMTPLRTALKKGQLDLVRELLKRRANTTGIMSKEWCCASGGWNGGDVALLSEAFDGDLRLDFPEEVHNVWGLYDKYPRRRSFLFLLTDETDSSVWSRVPFKIPKNEKLTAGSLEIAVSRGGLSTTHSIALWLPLDQFSSDSLSQTSGGKVSRVMWVLSIGRPSTVYLSTLPYGCIPDNLVDFFHQFLTHANTQWSELCSKAGEWLSRRREGQLMSQGKDPQTMDDLAKDARKLADLRRSLASQISEARMFMNKPSIRREPYESRKKLLKYLEEEFEPGVTKRLDELDQIARDLLQIEFAWSSVQEARVATKLGQNVMLLTYVSIFYLPLGFCAALWAIPNITDFSTRLPFAVTAFCVSLLTLLVTFNMETIASTIQKGYLYCKSITSRDLLTMISKTKEEKKAEDSEGSTQASEGSTQASEESSQADLERSTRGPKGLLKKILQMKEKKKTEDPNHP